MKALWSRFWTKARPHLPRISLALVMFVVGFDTSMMVDRHYGNVPKLRSIAEQCIAGWQSANETIERLRAARPAGFTK